MPPTILVVDDEPAIAELLTFNLTKAGYRVLSAGDGGEAIRLARQEQPDLVILDIMLPVADGLEVSRRLREDETTAAIPFLFLTARREEIDRIIGLELGADDYVTKPFSPRELVARVKAILRRSQRAKPPAKAGGLTIGELSIDAARHRVTVRGEPVQLTAREFALLQFLAENAGQVFSREALLEKLWDYAYFGNARTVDVHIRHLREKIEADPEAPAHLQTVRGVGYRLREN